MKNLTIFKVTSIVTLVLFVLDLFFNVAAVFPGPLLSLFFNNNTMKQSSTFVDSAIPASDWVFYIWILIYLYQLAWLGFTLYFAFFKKTCIVPTGTYVSFMFACIMNFVWLLTYSFNQIVTSFIIMFLLLASISFASYWGAIFIERCPEEEICRRTKKILKIIFVNGLFLYFSWIVVAQHIVLDNLLVFSGVAVNTSALAVLIVFFVLMVGSYFIDFYLIKQALYNTFVTYPVYALAFISILTNPAVVFTQLNLEIQIFLILDLIVAIILFSLKVYMVIRHSHYSHSTESRRCTKA